MNWVPFRTRATTILRLSAPGGRVVSCSSDWVRRNNGVALHLPSNSQTDLVGLALQLDPHQIDLTEDKIIRVDGKGNLDHSAIVTFIEEMANLEVKKP